MYETIIIIIIIDVENIIDRIRIYYRDYWKFIDDNVQIQLYPTINTFIYTSNLRNGQIITQIAFI